jgi:hypothetical protein
MNRSRRHALLSMLFGGGYMGLRALATGLPTSLLLSPRRALAEGTMCAPEKAQYFILSTCGSGDPINANVPGTYEDPNISHPLDPLMAKTPITLGATISSAAAPWAALPQDVLDRTCFWHLMTNTPVHPKEPEVLGLMGAIQSAEMLPSLLSKQLAPCLGTIQAQPITVGASSPSEGLTFDGAAQPIIPPQALKATLTAPGGPLEMLQPLRDQTLAQLYDLYKNGASPAQRAYIDALVTSQQQVRNIKQDLLDALSSIKSDAVADQITAALALIRMNVTPVVAIHIPFGGDNHNDAALATETAQTIAGVQAIGSLIAQLTAAGLQDQVTFVSLNVFGRTLGPANTDGRQHNQNHQVSITIGKPFRAGIIGGVAPVADDYGALSIDSTSGAAASDGDVGPIQSLAAFGKTLLAGVGVDQATIDGNIIGGAVITGALA